jgi:hypothetical protein
MKGKRKSTVALRLPPALVSMCEGHSVEPDQVIRGFIADLCELRTADYNTHRSDERRLAEHFYLHCSYQYLKAVAADRGAGRLAHRRARLPGANRRERAMNWVNSRRAT